MMRSMFSGVSSLRVHQTRMDVIANNIANVNTTGFKAQRATFADAFYQNIQGASGPNPDFGRAGMNPRQIGLGLSLASIDNLMHQGAAQRTDNALDVMIEGAGFFIVQDQGGANLFTRAGRIERDAHWNLHIGGMNLMGWGTVPDATVPGGHAVQRGLLQPLNLSEVQQMPSEPTTLMDIIGNLNVMQLSETVTDSDGRVIGGHTVRPMVFYDSLGNRYVVNVTFRFHGAFSEAADSPHSYWTKELHQVWENADGEEWVGAGAPPDGFTERMGVRAYLEGDRSRPAVIGVCLLNGRNMPTGGMPIDTFRDEMHTRVTIAFDSSGNFVGKGPVIGAPDAATDAIPIDFSEPSGPTTWIANSPSLGQGRFNIMLVPLSGVAPAATFGDTSGVVSTYGTGDPGFAGGDGTLTRIGTMTLNFSQLGQRGGEGTNTTLQMLPMNGGGPGELNDISIGPDGTIMGRYSNGRDRVLGQIPLAFFTNPAGLERLGNNLWRASANSGPFDGVGLIGSLIGGALEMSNVDLANEFTEMIVTQRGFQAASRTITVSDEMIQELVNLRR